ncbi:hypothetical protein [Dickeya dadantii]|uniref:hypothetical protein n=1 Tax=Dickeya dadantii TaxID=204038 RepID=UPI0031456854
MAAPLILLCVWAAGVTLFTGWSWLGHCRKTRLGGWVLRCFPGPRRKMTIFRRRRY